MNKTLDFLQKNWGIIVTIFSLIVFLINIYSKFGAVVKDTARNSQGIAAVKDSFGHFIDRVDADNRTDRISDSIRYSAILLAISEKKPGDPKFVLPAPFKAKDKKP